MPLKWLSTVDFSATLPDKNVTQPQLVVLTWNNALTVLLTQLQACVRSGGESQFRRLPVF
jgi:hypothetical protein